MEEIIEVQRGQKIINQGELGQGFFILQSGAVEVIKDEVLLSVIIHPGTFLERWATFWENHGPARWWQRSRARLSISKRMI